MLISRRSNFSEIPWTRWPMALLFSLAMNALLLGAIVQRAEKVVGIERTYPASVIEMPKPHTHREETSAKPTESGASSFAALAVDAPARPSVMEGVFAADFPSADFSALGAVGRNCA